MSTQNVEFPHNVHIFHTMYTSTIIQEQHKLVQIRDATFTVFLLTHSII